MDPRSGGPSHAIREMVVAQSQIGLSPSVIATNAQAAADWDDDLGFRESVSSEGIFQDVPLTIASSYGRSRPWSRYSWSPEAGRLLRDRLLDAERPEIVHIHGVFSHITQKAAHFALKAGVPYIIRPAGALDQGCLKRGRAVLKRLFIGTMLRRVIERAAFVHVTSEKEVKSIRDQFPTAKTKVLPHGTSFGDPAGGQFRERFSQLANRDYVLCLCRIHPIKRLDLAIRAFASVALEFPNTQMVIAGNDAGALDGLKTLVAELGLDARCLFTGFVAGADKARAYSEARVLLHTSDHENFGLSVVEAMTYGCPVVTTEGVASGVYVGEASAGVVVPSDVTEIATALRTVLNTPREEVGQRGAAFVEQNLTWPRIANRLTGLYETAINRRAASGEPRPSTADVEAEDENGSS